MSLAVQRKQTSQAIAELWHNTFFNRYWRAIGTLLGRGKETSIWISAAVVMLVNVVVGVSISALLGETRFTGIPAILTNLMWGVYTYFVIITNKRLHSSVLEFVRQRLIDSIDAPQHVHDLQTWAEQWLGSIGRQFLFNMVFALILAFFGFYGIYHTTHFSIGVLLIYFVNYFHLGPVVYGLISLIAFLLRLQNWSLTLFPDDPANSPILLQLSAQLRNYLLVYASFVALFMLLVLLIGALNIIIIIEFLIINWIPILTLFILGHLAFASLVTRVKHERMAELQSKIMKLSSQDKTSTKTTQIMKLMDYHDRVKATRNSLINSQSILNLMGSLALPLLATLIQDYMKELFS